MSAIPLQSISPRPAAPGRTSIPGISPELVRPDPLLPGETIGVVAPSYAPRTSRLQRGAKALREAGYEVRLDPEVEIERRFSKSEDERRAENFMGMWLQPDVRAVICGTGGYGVVRMLPYLDPEIFRMNPKIFVGYSDITALHSWLMRQANLRVFHGPTVDDLIPGAHDPTLASLLSALSTPHPDLKLGQDMAKMIRPGTARGRLVGGNFSLVQQTIGTQYQIDTRDSILFLEETDDPMSFVDERLVHLRSAGLLENVRGIVFGQLSLDRSEEDEFENFLIDLLSDYDIPVIMDFPAGHEVPNLTLPLGTVVELGTEGATGWLQYAEPALTPSSDELSPADIVARIESGAA